MSATTFVTRLDEAAGRRLYEELGRGPYSFRSLEHAHWSARGPDATVTWYRSGKLVVQGRGAGVFVTQYLPGAASEGGKRAAQTTEVVSRVPEIGTDESGKGDTIGPLTVAAVLVRPEDDEGLRALGVQDSKATSDAHIRRVEGAILGATIHAVRELSPEAYNAAWQAAGNLNRLLGRLHAEVIEEVVAAAPAGRLRIVVDRFGDPEHVRRHLGQPAAGHVFVMKTRAESHTSVAAASFLARAAFLRGFEELKGLAGDELYRGASDPRILKVARRLLREGGEPWLGKFAKLHFKTTNKARGG